mmetsp:Transcript_20902/g.62361  ORF Transcript_20902/g.62361 Transcript_20902/m.62361 type:complete len:345 (-) Transcript_20902:42-1076(-)
MARAYLSVDVALANEFLRVQAEPATRWLLCRVKGEAVCLEKSGAAGASVEADFDTLKADAGLDIDEPAFVVFARSEGLKRGWQLVVWVPDSAKPQLKMIYSSSREDLKSSLGAGFFSGFKDYCCNEPADLVWAHVVESEKDHAAPLTETEILVKEEQGMEKDSRRSSIGMASVPFHLDAEAAAALDAFKSGAASFVEVVVAPGETLKLAQGALALKTDDSVKDALAALDAPRFVLVQRAGQRLFVYYCPEAAPIKAKMTYSTAKATFAGLLAERDLAPTSTLEIRDAADLDSSISGVVAPPADDRKITHAANTRPKAKGRRGSTRASKKFVAPAGLASIESIGS